jgi:hypothetical protein
MRMDPGEILWESEHWIHLVQDRDSGGLFEHGNGPLGSVRGGEFLD